MRKRRRTRQPSNHHPPIQGNSPPSPTGRGVGGEGRRVLDPDLREFARSLRAHQTDAESLMWMLLRNRRFCGFKFRRQQPVAPYVLDFYCAEAGLAIELDGGQHNTPDNRSRDQKRTEFLANQGIRLVRFWNDDVLRDTDTVLEVIYRALHEECPHPGPLPEGEGEGDEGASP